mmetsp:Transcript_12869/g.21455  ORF Transcript_12869/g.21455 Transcript_12869/m.21455 type:complete len:85 (-) Transcript_12869:264-518(-)
MGLFHSFARGICKAGTVSYSRFLHSFAGRGAEATSLSNGNRIRICTDKIPTAGFFAYHGKLGVNTSFFTEAAVAFDIANSCFTR